MKPNRTLQVLSAVIILGLLSSCSLNQINPVSDQFFLKNIGGASSSPTSAAPVQQADPVQPVQPEQVTPPWQQPTQTGMPPQEVILPTVTAEVIPTIIPDNMPELTIRAYQTRNEGEKGMEEIFGTLSKSCTEGTLPIDQYGFNEIPGDCGIWAFGLFPYEALRLELFAQGKLIPGFELAIHIDQSGAMVRFPGYLGFTVEQIARLKALVNPYADVAIEGNCKFNLIGNMPGTLREDGSDWNLADGILDVGIYAPNQYPWNLARDGRQCPSAP